MKPFFWGKTVYKCYIQYNFNYVKNTWIGKKTGKYINTLTMNVFRGTAFP